MEIKPQAQPWSADARPELTGGRRVGVLLSHGFTGSPFSMRPWAEFLHAQGYAVEVPRLPGHGTSWQDMNTTTWDDWYAEVSSAFQRLRDTCDTVFCFGLSMGGGLMLRLALDHPEGVAGLVLVNPAVNSTNKQLIALPVIKRIVSGIPGIGNDVKKAGIDEYGYPKVPLKALSTLLEAWKTLRSELSGVKAPLLIFRSSVDHVVDPSSAKIILGSVSSAEAAERILTNSYHVATLDNDAQEIFESSLEFLRRHVT